MIYEIYLKFSAILEPTISLILSRDGGIESLVLGGAIFEQSYHGTKRATEKKGKWVLNPRNTVGRFRHQNKVGSAL